MKNLIKFLIAASAIALASQVAFALDVTDESVGGTTAPGASSMNRALVFTSVFDIETGDGMDGTNIVQTLSVPAGIAPERVWMVPDGLDWTTSVTLYRKMGTNDWEAVGNAQTVTEGAEVPVMYTLVTPTYSNPQETNTVVSMSDYDTPQNSEYLAVSKWGFLAATSGTNDLATAGTITISVIGYDVDPASRD